MSDAFDYGAMRDVADALLTQFGQTVTLRQVTNTGGTSWEPTQANKDTVTVAAIVNLPRWYPSFTEGDVLRTDRMAYISAGPLTAAGVVPTPFDRLIDASGRSWKIIDIKPVYPSGLNVVYTAQLRI